MEAIEACVRLMSRGNAVTIRWTPAHVEVEGNEMADLYARGTAESELYAVGRAYMRETSLSRVTRLATEAGAGGTNG